MGGYSTVNYPAQPSYGEGLADALTAQINLLTGTGDFAPELIGVEGGLLGTIPLEREARLAYAQIEPELTARTLGLQQVGPEGRYVTGQRYFDQAGQQIEGARQIESEDDVRSIAVAKSEMLTDMFENPETSEYIKANNLAEIQRVKKDIETQYPNDKSKQYAAWGEYISKQSSFPSAQKELRLQSPELGEYYDPANIAGGALTEEDVYKAGTPGSFVGTETGGMIDLLGGGTDVVQYDPVTMTQSIGQAGFDKETGEFQGLIPMQAQAQAYTDDIRAAAAARRGAKLAEGITGAIREQGNIGALVNQISDIREGGDIAAAPIRNEALRQGFELLGRGLSDREREQIEQASRTAGVQAGRVRDIGRIQSEVGELVEQDRMRQIQNLQAASGILGQEMGMQRQDFGELLQQLGAEQATAADPSTWAGAQTMAPSAQGLLGAGAGMAQQAGPQLINPEAGLGYISQRAANQATMAAGQQAGRGSMMGGLLKGLGSIAAAPMTGGVSLLGKAFGG